MNITYLNIANFSLGEPGYLFQFFVELKEGEDPFAIYLPKKDDFYKGNTMFNWLEK